MRPVLVSQLHEGADAGFKAPSDVRRILADSGSRIVDRAPRTSRAGAMIGALRVASRLAWEPPTSAIIFQYPRGALPGKLLSRLRPKKVALVHDLWSLRTGVDSEAEVETMLRYDAIIVHTMAMQKWLQERLPRSRRLITLNMFDYLVQERQPLPEPASHPEHLYYAGNLRPEKSTFLYARSGRVPPLVVYGGGFNRRMASRNVQYGGKLHMDMPQIVRNGFGLVWDGESPDALVGLTGEYMHFNAPHKLSFYVAAGIPVIVPASSAVAPYVHETGIGVGVQSVDAAYSFARDCHALHWQKMCQAVTKLRDQVMTGWHTRRAVTEACGLLAEGGVHTR